MDDGHAGQCGGVGGPCRRDHAIAYHTDAPVGVVDDGEMPKTHARVALAVAG